MNDAQFAASLEAAKAGDGAAFAALYQWCAPAVAGYLRAQGLDADELTNDVFVGVFRRLRSFEGDARDFRSWVFTVAHSRLVDARRRASRRPGLVPMETDHLPQQPDESAEQRALAAFAEDRVRRLLGRLAPDQRDVLALRLIADLTVEQCATTLGKSVGAVKALQRRGLASLRRVIEHEGVPL